MRETNKARKAFEDYYALGASRSLEKLYQKYTKGTPKNAPTRTLRVLKEWSTKHGWQQRVADRDGELAKEAWEANKEQVLKGGFALPHKRIFGLNMLAERLQELFTEAKPNPALIREFRGALGDIAEETGGRGKPFGDGDGAKDFSVPAYMLAPNYIDLYRDIREHKHTEYVLHGGRGSLKSTFTSEVSIELLINNPTVHMLATRQVGNTLRDSVFAQLRWAIGEMGLEDKFRHTLTPLEIEYLPTGQKIYFRGGDDPIKIKSIKPAFGYIGILWFEELDQYHGPEPVRSIEQSAIRGGDLSWIFKTWNTSRTINNWTNKYIQIPKETQFRHHSTYLTVPPEWLGKTFLEEASHLKAVNPLAYEHEYMGVANGTGGRVFENVKIKPISNEQIAEFDRVLHGADWGYFPDPFSYGKMHYDAARMTLYIFDEYRANKQSNKQAWEAIKDKVGNGLLIADSSEPKSVADLRAYGANIRGAEKGPDSVDYSMKWLQSQVAIVIDAKRCPYHAEEFLNYELEMDKDGEYISAYPDKANHAIDDARYATNLIWRQRGK